MTDGVAAVHGDPSAPHQPGEDEDKGKTKERRVETNTREEEEEGGVNDKRGTSKNHTNECVLT